jgi:hypothetical protein
LRYNIENYISYSVDKKYDYLLSSENRWLVQIGESANLSTFRAVEDGILYNTV